MSAFSHSTCRAACPVESLAIRQVERLRSLAMLEAES